MEQGTRKWMLTRGRLWRWPLSPNFWFLATWPRPTFLTSYLIFKMEIKTQTCLHCDNWGVVANSKAACLAPVRGQWICAPVWTAFPNEATRPKLSHPRAVFCYLPHQPPINSLFKDCVESLSCFPRSIVQSLPWEPLSSLSPVYSMCCFGSERIDLSEVFLSQCILWNRYF